MINIYRNQTKVHISIETGLNTKSEIIFTHECGDEMFAELLRDKLTQKLHSRVEKIREIEYLSGRRDSRKPGKKRNWFYSSLTDSKY